LQYQGQQQAKPKLMAVFTCIAASRHEPDQDFCKEVGEL
jgi:hypothetical protein